MFYSLIICSLLFIVTGFIVTKKNAAQILAGYNTMSKKNQEKVDLIDLLSFFKKFHIFLGLSFFLLGCIVNEINQNFTKFFLIIYTIIAYLYFIIRSRKFYKKTSKK